MRIGPQRPVNPDAIVAPQGYRVEALVTGLTFPSAISFGPGGELYVAEAGGVAGSRVASPRVLRIDPDRSVNEIGRLENPIVGLVYRNGELLIGEDGPSPRILRVTAEGDLQVLVDNLPGGGDYGLNGLALDPGGALLFGLGTRTNSGVVGLDNLARGWVTRNPEWADVPGADVQLAGINYVTAQSTPRGTSRAATGGFRPYRTRSDRGDVVRGANLCSGAIYRIPAEGNAEPERLAWGLRNPIGLACAPDGRLYATEGGMEERGSRPIAGASDNLWEVRPGSYYGWPDHAGGIPVTDPRFRLPGHPQPRRLLDNAPKAVATPTTCFASRAGVGRLDFSTSEEFGFVGDALVALSGSWSTPAFGTDEAVGGHRVVRVDPRTGAVTDFLVNRQGGPSSEGNTGGLERPFDVRFDPSGEVLYVVDMGEVQLSREYGLEPFGGTGVVWRITPIRVASRASQSSRRSVAQEEEAAADQSDELSDETVAEELTAETPEEIAAEAPEPEAAAEEATAEEAAPESEEVEAPVEPAVEGEPETAPDAAGDAAPETAPSQDEPVVAEAPEAPAEEAAPAAEAAAEVEAEAEPSAEPAVDEAPAEAEPEEAVSVEEVASEPDAAEAGDETPVDDSVETPDDSPEAAEPAAVEPEAAEPEREA